MNAGASPTIYLRRGLLSGFFVCLSKEPIGQSSRPILDYFASRLPSDSIASCASLSNVLVRISQQWPQEGDGTLAADVLQDRNQSARWVLRRSPSEWSLRMKHQIVRCVSFFRELRV